MQTTISNLTQMAESYELFLLFPQCFQKACFPGASKGVIVWEWVKLYKAWICAIASAILSKLQRNGLQRYTNKQEGQDGPGSLTLFFEIALAIFFWSFSEKNLQEFLYACTVQEASVY